MIEAQYNQKNHYYGLDMFKFIAAIMVIWLHTMNAEFANSLSEVCLIALVKIPSRIAVPFFFIASSFFLHKNGISKDATLKYVRRLFCLYLAWFLFYFPIENVPYDSNRWIAKYLQLKWFFIDGGWFLGWYLLASIWTSLLFLLFKRWKIGDSLLLLISVVLYVPAVMTSSYAGLEFIKVPDALDIKVYNTVCSSTLYFTIGYLTAKHIHIIEGFSHRLGGARMIGLALAAMLLNYGEFAVCYVNGWNRGMDAFLSLPITVTIVFLYLLRYKSENKNNKYIKLRKYSTAIYCMQYGFLIMIYSNHTPWMICDFAIVAFLTVSLSILLVKLSERWKWIGAFYN